MIVAPYSAQESVKTKGGIYYPKYFNPEKLLSVVEDLVDTSDMYELNPFTNQRQKGPKRHFLDTVNLQNSNDDIKIGFLREELSTLSRNMGHIVVNPMVTVLIYAPDETLAPHTDENKQSPLFTLKGEGHFDTFDNEISVIEKIYKNEYPDERTSEILVSPGDALLSISNVLHGFRNGDEPRIALGLIETPEI